MVRQLFSMPDGLVSLLWGSSPCCCTSNGDWSLEVLGVTSVRKPSGSILHSQATRSWKMDVCGWCLMATLSIAVGDTMKMCPSKGYPGSKLRRSGFTRVTWAWR